MNIRDYIKKHKLELTEKEEYWYQAGIEDGKLHARLNAEKEWKSHSGTIYFKVS